MVELKFVEPLKANRWLIKTEGVDIQQYLFRKYKIYNEGPEIIFKTEFYESVTDNVNPKDLLNLTSITIEYLDPTGAVVNSLNFDVKGVNFKQKQSYSKDDLMITKLRVVVNKDTMKLLTPLVKRSKQ
jgi:hypothetical protein